MLANVDFVCSEMFQKVLIYGLSILVYCCHNNWNSSIEPIKYDIY